MIGKATLSKALRDLDIFGREITLTYRGERKFKTELGGVFSIVSMVIVLAIGISTIFKVAKNEMTSFASQVKFVYPDERQDFGFQLENVGFHAAFGIIGTDIDPTYGSVKISHVKKTIDLDRIQG